MPIYEFKHMVTGERITEVRPMSQASNPPPEGYVRVYTSPTLVGADSGGVHSAPPAEPK